MKRAIVLCSVLFSLMIANPVYLPSVYLSELFIPNSTQWTIEFKLNYTNVIGADSLKLESNDGIESIINIDTTDYFLITNANLSDSLNINSNDDIIIFHYYKFNDQYNDTLRIGNAEGSYIKNINQGESISRYSEWYTNYYKDSSPTLGQANDVDGASGNIYGYVYDYNSQPITNKYFFIDEGISGQIFLNENGYYSTDLLSKSYYYDTKRMYITSSNSEVLTFNTVTYNLDPGESKEVNMYQIETSIRPVIQNTIKFNNYPHPASSYTWFVIDNTDIEASAMRVNVYALNGRKVDSFIPSAYQCRYDCSKLAQGSYIMTLQHGHEVLATKKLQILK